MKKNMIIGCMMLGLLVCVPSVGAQGRYDYELAYGYSGQDSGYRNAVAMDDWLERGRAAVAESPVFSDGIRITAWGGAEADEPGLASAIYYFNVPRWAQYLKINIRYNDAAQDDQIAGRLWIKSVDSDMRGEIGAGEEAPFYGDTFVLRSERSSETIIVPASRHVAGGMLEMHVVAEGSDCIDVQDIRVAYLHTSPQIRMVRRTYSDYWYRWPRHRYAYHYYYWGPLFWPRTYVVYECWDVPFHFYWTTWRPWFFFNIIRAHCHRPWWGPRRYTVVYHVDVKHPFHERSLLLRKRLKGRHPHITRTIRPKHLTKKPVPLPFKEHFIPQQKVQLKKEGRGPHTVEKKRNPNPIQRPPQERFIQPHKEGRGPHTVEKKRNPNPIQRQPEERSIRPHKAPPTPPMNTRTKTVTPKRIHKDQRQPHTVKRQPHSGPVVRETVRETPRVREAPNHRAQPEAAIQNQSKMRQGNTPQSRQETRQLQPQTRQRRSR